MSNAELVTIGIRLLDLSVTSPGQGWGIDLHAVPDPDRGRTGLRRVRCQISPRNDQ